MSERRRGRVRAVYALIDPETGEARYIGISSDPRARWREHIQEGMAILAEPRWLANPKRAWVAEMVTCRGRSPRCVILQRDGSEEDERAWMVRFAAAGHRLLNTAGLVRFYEILDAQREPETVDLATYEAVTDEKDERTPASVVDWGEGSTTLEALRAHGPLGTALGEDT